MQQYFRLCTWKMLQYKRWEHLAQWVDLPVNASSWGGRKRAGNSKLFVTNWDSGDVHSQADKILASTKVTVHQSSIQDNTLANPLTSLSTSTSTFRRKPQQQKKSTKRRQCVTTGVQRYVQTQIVRASDFCDTSICVRVCMCGACMFCWSFLMWQS